MMQVISLIEVVMQLGGYSHDSTIYALVPWTPRSPAIVAVELDSGGVPPEAAANGLTYFLEVNIAQDFIEDWKASLDTAPSPLESCRRLVDYAINDA